MDSPYFENYFEATQKLAESGYHDSEKLEELLAFIEKHAKENAQHPLDSEFFKGEHDFYSKRYERALKHYLEARSIKNFEFFCYRVSAFISHARGLMEKANTFAKKALAIYPNDYFTLMLLKPQKTISHSDHEQQLRISLGNQEIKELTEIFKGSSEKESLFIDEPFHSKILEPTMNTDASLFSFPKSQDAAMTAILTQRLYPFAQENLPYKSTDNPLDEIKKELLENSEHEHSIHTLSHSLADTHELENCIASFQKTQAEKMHRYRESAHQRKPLPDFCLYILTGSGLDTFQLTEDSRKATGGYFLRWNKKGIVINPGKNFMHHFHSSGLNIQDIDFVIVTQDNPNNYVDIQEIYDLNYQLNRKNNQHLQIIHYYLIQNAYQELSRKLKPNFKQERHTIHHMDLFLDSPETEKIDLNQDISLHYFPASTVEALTQNFGSPQEKLQKSPSSLGIRIELKFPNEKKTLSIGYLSGTSWTPLIGHHLGHCDVLIAGIGNTQPNDYHKVSYMEDCLGYFGCYSLLEEIAPKLMICTEFGGREGDIRLELLKKMRNDLPTKHSTVLPGDLGLILDLNQLKIKCSISDAFVDPAKIHITKSSSDFGRLHYLATNCYL